ncbi:hemerythrin HHE cation binding domain-containing protein [Coniochaeta sp. 2T2.1]|nr:hemerythrin HHE cation binding domain-containing protein [Coniochaeta sp. 2T2.1]
MASLRTSLRAAPRLFTKPQLASIYTPAFAVRSFSATARNDGRVSDAIIEDHKELKSYYDKIMSSHDPKTQTEYQNLFVWELARHSIAEEIVVYPAFEKHVPDGKNMAKKDRQEHRTVKEKLYEFQKLSWDEPEFKPTLQSLMDDLSHHIKEEEQDDLPALEKAIAEADSDRMAKSFERTKMFVPTRSHPSSPDRPPFETAMGLLAAPMDKLMDMFRKFPHK